ncbi:glycerophosphodiester phosphodiesterase, partial [Singulisphaera rosea]
RRLEAGPAPRRDPSRINPPTGGGRSPDPDFRSVFMFSGLMVGLAVALATAGDVEWIAHRGESADAPENTMAAFRLAWERNVAAIELDVHLSKDGALVVSHDPNTKRTTGVSKEIKESSLEELRSLDAGRWKDPKWAGEKMPTLEDVLPTIPDGSRCFIEIKVGPEAVPALVKAVQASKKRPEQLAIISFQADAVAEAKRELPQIKAYYLSSFRKDKTTGQWQPSLDELIAKAKSIRADGLDLSHQGPLDRDQVRRIKAAGLEVYTWTVDDPAIARRLIEAGVDGVTSNKAAGLKDQLQK